MKSKLMSWCLLLCVLLASLTGHAEDIDLFVGASSSSTADAPNVLIVLDNTANWNTAFVNEKAALVSLFNGLPVNKFRVGLMMFTETGGGGVAGNSGNDGAYVRAAIRLMNSTNKPIYASLINSFDQTGDKSNGGKAGLAMEEAFYYLTGCTPYAGNNKGKTDYTGSTNGTAQDRAVYALSGNALLTKSATTYISPLPSPCAKNYIIYISNGPAQDNAADTSQATTALSNVGGVTTVIPLNPSGSQSNVADEWLRFIKLGPNCSISKIEAYNNGNGTTPPALTVADYTDACVVGVTVGNLATVNASVLAQAPGGASSRAKVQALVPCTVGAGALAKVEAYNNGDGTTPPALTVADYTDACVFGVTSCNLTRVNAFVLAQGPGGADTTSKVQELVYTTIDGARATTYTMDVNKGATGQGPGWTALLKSMAAVSGGKYFDVSSSGTQIVDALNNIFSEIQSVNSVFASVSLPVSVNTQGTYLNQVYVGMFRPDADSNPRWAGNLKQYKIGQVNSTTLELEDADGTNAVNTQTGFITECARSYWTPSTVDTEWTFRPQGDCLSVANSQVSNYPDGNVVEKGAQAYQLRGSSTRTVYTCSGACTALATFNTSSSGLSSTLVDWAIGNDVQDEDIDLVITERRLSDHGDVVHSRPVAVDFGSTGSPSVVVFYGANDGMLRAVNGNRSNAIGSIPAGGELWSFMPSEFYSSIQRLYDNTIKISYPGSGGGSPKSYGMDGPITAFKGTVGGASKVFVYATMRRGGRSIYAFDASAPTSPSLKWKAGCPNMANDTGCTTNGASLSGIGQTWSSVKTFTTTGYGSGASPLVIFGGGYDTCEDYDAGSSGGANNNCTSSSKGHYVYVLDADTGTVVKTFDTGGTRGMIADVTLVRNSSDQVIYGYTADLGGNVYRITFGTNAAANWTMTKIASLGCSTTATCTANRKFVFAPSVVSVDGNYAIMLGSGDREKPLTYFAAATAVSNYFFMFTDKPSVAAATWPGSTDCSSNIICMNSLLGITSTSTPDATALAAKKGWYLGLSSTEQVVTSAITLFGTVSFSTHQPAVPTANVCNANLGTTLSYNVNYTNAAPPTGTDRYADLAGDGLPPSPVGGKVQLDDGALVPFCIGCGKDSPLAPTLPSEGGGSASHKSRLYWYIQK